MLRRLSIKVVQARECFFGCEQQLTGGCKRGEIVWENSTIDNQDLVTGNRYEMPETVGAAPREPANHKKFGHISHEIRNSCRIYRLKNLSDMKNL